MQKVVTWKSIIGIIVAIALIITLIAVAIPIYNVWASEKNGQAELAQGEYNRQLAVVESKAKLDAAKNLADAEIVRATGVAKANEIIGESLKDNSEYLDYLWLTEKITASNKEVIYVPTETQLPILEATRNLN
jgi:regulator of protease activity HflC (stomatin/prohibitin superfamily)